MAWLLRKPPLPCHRGGGEPSGWVGGGLWGSLQHQSKNGQEGFIQGSSKFNVFFWISCWFARPCGEMRPWWPTFGTSPQGRHLLRLEPQQKWKRSPAEIFFLGNRTKWRFIVGKINDKWWISQQAMFDDRRVGIRLKRGPRIVERWEVVKTRIDFTNIRGVWHVKNSIYTSNIPSRTCHGLEL